MPELPEVETNARNLGRWSRGHRITSVTPPAGARGTAGVPARELVKRLEGRRVEEVVRRGKWILVRLSGSGGLGLHLGMTGKLARVRAAEALPRFTRAVLELDDGTRIAFVDSRRFGRMVGERSWQELVAREEIASVGPDALAIDATALHAILAGAGTTRTVKEAIMDQRKLAGVGNLYATEALWRAKIHPATRARRVAGEGRAPALLRAIVAALRQGLAEHGDTELPQYLEDGAPNPFYAYDRVGQRCRRCKRGVIEAITIGGRTSPFCPVCQRK